MATVVLHHTVLHHTVRGAHKTDPPPPLAQPLDGDDEPKTRPLDFNLIRWILAYARPHAAKRNTLVVLTLLRALQLPLLGWALGRVIDGPIAHHSTSGLLWGCLGFLALAAFTHFTFHFRQRLALELGEAVVHDLRDDVFTHLQQMQMDFFNDTRLGRIISRVTSDADAVRLFIQDVLFVSIVVLGQMLTAAVIMFCYDGVLLSIVAAMLPVLWAVNCRFRAKLSQAHRAVQESFSRVTSSVAESIQGIHVTQAAVRQKVNAQRFDELVEDHSHYNVDVARISGLFVPLLDLSTQTFLATVIVLGGYRVLTPGVELPLGDLIQFLFLANIFFQPIQSIGDQYNQALSAMAGAERLRRLLDTQPQWKDGPHTIQLPTLVGRVRFEHVSFAYQPDRPVLDDIHFSVKPGQTVALVGETGSGKTSLVSLIAKFYLPTAGRLLIDGHDIRDIDSRWLHRHVAVVLQQNFLFSGTVLNNIRLGRPEASDGEVAEAIARLGCLDLLESLPCGLHTEVGESGSRLSLGQRQLVCFARAMLADPRILVLDEATSSIDVFTEQRIQQALGRLLDGRTSFVVAHRLSTIRDADLVLVLDHGRIVEQGNTQQLLAAGGRYAAECQRSAVPIAA
jgi:ATP-binding cassette, subfamily B, bacterial